MFEEIGFQGMNQNVCGRMQQKPELIVIGTGASGMMDVPDQTRMFIKRNNIKLIVEKTAEAVESFNKAKEKKVGLFHLTC